MKDTDSFCKLRTHCKFRFHSLVRDEFDVYLGMLFLNLDVAAGHLTIT